MSKHHVTTTINGEPMEYLCEAQQTMLDVLRDELGLTGSKEGCSSGDCGACTIICDGDIVTPTACQTGVVYCYTCIHRWLEGMHPKQEDFMQGRDGQWESGMGRCATGTLTCAAGGNLQCTPLAPIAEQCNGIDDDCDGTIDEGPSGAAGSLTRVCFTGPAGTFGGTCPPPGIAAVGNCAPRTPCAGALP